MPVDLERGCSLLTRSRFRAPRHEGQAGAARGADRSKWLDRAGAPMVTASLREELRERLTSWDDLLQSNPAEARPVLRKLLEGRLVLTPKNRKGGRWYEITGQASYGALLAGVVSLVAPG